MDSLVKIPKNNNDASSYLSADLDDGLVSVIIPNYNHAEYLGAAIESVLSQDYRNYEILVIDDGSTDNSREVVAKYGDQVRYIWQQNQGLSAARNTGIENANGAYIGLLDADDLYESDFLSTTVATLSVHPELHGVYCGYQFIDQHNNPLPQREVRLVSDQEFHPALLDGNFLVPEAFLLRKKCYQTEKFDIALSACEDWDMWLRLTNKFRIVGLNKILIRHRILPRSMSADPTRMLRNRLAVLDKYFQPLPEDVGLWPYAARRAYSRAFLSSAIEYIQAHDRTQSIICLNKMVSINPDLLTEKDTLYEICLGDQPKGFRGDFKSVNIAQNTALTLDLLDQIYGNSKHTFPLIAKKRDMYSKAYLTLGTISYGARQFRLTRSLLLSSLKNNNFIFFDKTWIYLMVKSLPGIASIVMWKTNFRESKANR